MAAKKDEGKTLMEIFSKEEDVPVVLRVGAAVDPLADTPRTFTLKAGSCGFARAPDDPRDRLFTSGDHKLKSTSGEHIVSRAYEVPILDQEDLGFCVPHGVIGILMLLRATQGLPLVRFSPLHLGWMSKNIDGSTCVDDGTYVRSAMGSLKTTGVCRESLWPYKVSEFAKRPPLGAIEDGYDHRIEGYARIPVAGRADAVEELIRSDHGVVFGTDVGQPFLDYDGKEDLVWQQPSHPKGSHCMYLDGVRYGRNGGAMERQYRIVNSWGSGWGQFGRAWMSERWLTSPWTSDLWYATLAP